ncbi:MAG TPA: GNAT family N-acetyltransferase, partial [Anaerolineaceae bacterium]|nr:GNAT family N-acetyltransferase [Anaerolineaceae bacterium]
MEFQYFPTIGYGLQWDCQLSLFTLKPDQSLKTMSIESLFQSFPQLETKNLILRRMQGSDSNALFRILSDAEVTRYYDDAAFTEMDQASDQINAWENGFINRRNIRWGIVRKGDHEIIGTCGYYGFHTW